MVPERVVAIGTFSDASVEPVVRKANQALLASLERDGLKPKDDDDDDDNSVTFAQYDAIYSMGKRRGEVWLTLDDNNNPWSME